MWSHCEILTTADYSTCQEIWNHYLNKLTSVVNARFHRQYFCSIFSVLAYKKIDSFKELQFKINSASNTLNYSNKRSNQEILDLLYFNLA